jgi:hypothetical protein
LFFGLTRHVLARETEWTTISTISSTPNRAHSRPVHGVFLSLRESRLPRDISPGFADQCSCQYGLSVHIGPRLLSLRCITDSIHTLTQPDSDGGSTLGNKAPMHSNGQCHVGLHARRKSFYPLDQCCWPLAFDWTRHLSLRQVAWQRSAVRRSAPPGDPVYMAASPCSGT